MTGMTEVVTEDMNATPLAKLPPPVLQSKQSQPPLELPNYRDLLHDVDHSKQGQQPQQLQQLQQPMQQLQPLQPQRSQSQQFHHQQPQQQFLAAQQQHHNQQHHMPQEYMNQDVYATQNTYVPQQYGNPMYAPQQQYYPPPTPNMPMMPDDGPAAERSGNALVRFIKSNKATFVVILLVFVTLFFVGPRLAKYPKFSATDAFGSPKLSVLGMVAAAVLAGGVFRLSLLAM